MKVEQLLEAKTNKAEEKVAALILAAFKSAKIGKSEYGDSWVTPKAVTFQVTYTDLDSRKAGLASIKTALGKQMKVLNSSNWKSDRYSYGSAFVLTLPAPLSDLDISTIKASIERKYKVKVKD